MVFLSYCWAESDFADSVEEYLSKKNFDVLRDKSRLKKTDSITDFMDKIESSDYVILLISEAYLRSYNCLYEAIAAYKGKNKQNLIPVVFNNAHVFDYNKQIDLISFWNENKTKLTADSECLNSINKIEISKRLRQMDVILNYLGDFLAFISDINCILSDADEDSLANIHTCLCDKILAQEIRYNAVPINHSIILPNKILLCIDFGTSYTLASVVDIYGNKHLIPNINGQTIVRSTIELNDDGKYFIGGSDINAIKNIKRFIGAKEYIKYGKRKFDIRILIAMILKSVLRNAEEYLNIKISEVLMAIPTDFDLSQRKILKESALLAGVTVYRFVPESSAETFLMQQSADGTAYWGVVIDLGGGTLDISLVNIEDNVYEVVYIDGDSNFGSINFDEALSEYITDKVCKELHCRNEDVFAQILKYSEHIKCQLSNHQSVNISCEIYSNDGNINVIPLSISREEFELITKDLSLEFTRKLNLVKGFYFKHKRLYGEDSTFPPLVIYLTGQGTKLYTLRNLVEEVFSESLVISEYQESALIHGLSIQNNCLISVNPQMQYHPGLLLNLSYFSLILKCYKYNKKKTTALISPTHNNKDLMLLDQKFIPYRREIELQFITEGDNTGPLFELSIYQKRTSAKTSLLKCIKFEPQKGMSYSLLLDIDANFNVNISLCGEPEGKGMEKKIIKSYLF